MRSHCKPHRQSFHHDPFPEPSFRTAFEDRVKSEAGIMALEIADKISDMILFHTRVRRNGIKMMQPVEEDW